MAQLAIKSHKTRGNEVIEILEMLGGRNDRNYVGELPNYAYAIDKRGIIDWHIQHEHDSFQYDTFTLEEFLEKFPYKVGDKVSSKYLKNYGISKMEWDYLNDRVIYQLQEMGWYSTYELRPYKKETMGEKLEEITLDIPGGYEFFGINDDNQVVLTKKQIQYPKTYEECCKLLNIPVNGDVIYAGNWTYGGEYLDKCLDILRKFQQLLICRDAYWKIAGEQMGLGKSWKPDWSDLSTTFHESIKINNGRFTYSSRVLVFPTEEMCDAFYENFKDLIDKCKELL